MRLIFVLGGALAAVLGGTVAYVATQPDALHVERTRVIPVDAQVLYDQADDFTAWGQWNPWDDLDPNLVKVLEGPPAGVGAAYTWEGNDQVGRGRMEILEVDPGRRIHYALRFDAPMEADQTTTLTFVPEAGGTRVTWSLDGHNDLLGKLFGLLLDFDAMVGADFEKGLARLETVARTETDRRAAAEEAQPPEDAARE